MFELVIILVILILLSAFFSSSETALFSLNETKIRAMLEEKRKGANILYRLKKNPKKLIIAILLGNNIVNIAASALATFIAMELLGIIGIGVAIGVMTFFVLTFGEIIPKSVAVINAEKLSIFMAKPILFITYLFSPLVWIFEQITKFVGSPIKNSISGSEIKAAAMMGLESGTIKKEEQKIIKRAIDFVNINAEDVMTPRIDMFCLDGNLTLREAISDISESSFSRIPVYLGNKDNIVGILYVKDILKYATIEKYKNVKLTKLIKKAFVIPEKMAIDKLLKEFQRRHLHMAIIVDEHGGVVGIVTMEDLLEELVGEIIDESDIDKKLIMRLDKKTILVDGDTEIDDINDFLNIRLPGKMTDTISALILETIERIPKKGEKIRIKNLILTIEEITSNEIKRVKIEKQ